MGSGQMREGWEQDEEEGQGPDEVGRADSDQPTAVPRLIHRCVQV